MEDNNTEYLLQTKNISKSFPGVKALDKVSIELKPGEVLGLVGENGAGKTTLMNILTGVMPPDEGEIVLDGEEVRFANPLDSREEGIAYIHQELNLIEELTVKENLFLGDLPSNTRFSLNYSEMEERAEKVFTSLGLDVDPNVKLETLPVALRQMVEIARALLFDAEIIIMDEPTSSLTDEEIETLLDLIIDLRDAGRSVIYISHRLEEVFSVTDRVMVLRNGKEVGTKPTEKTDRDEIVKMMAGKEIEQRYYKEETEVGTELLRVENLIQRGSVNGVSLTVHSGEILGIAGLMGAGRTELAETLFGITPPDSGEITLRGESFYPTNPHKAINNGIAYLPEDRGSKGLFMDFDVKGNINISKVEKGRALIDRKETTDPVNEVVDELDIVTPSIDTEVKGLSGGNKQKVIFGRWVFAGMDLLIVNEPTRGIDVQTKVEIYRLLYDLNEQGVGILLVSSELPEILTVSDRIAVMHEGEIIERMARNEANKETLVDLMTGGLVESEVNE